MLMGELAKETGLSKDTIRFYEKLGLITAQERQAGSRIYKEFGEETVDRLKWINRGKVLGFTLNEIKPWLDVWQEGTLPQSELIALIEQKLIDIAEKIQQLSEIEADLTATLSRLRQQK
ncbi:MAG: MerR family DNA-binding protein [Stenomitos rutilans HA7619-LM2]|jgi:MerR family Zn(II)-responsive transcriptional regulator of zntA|nr:MerR family DNA-binding protein [Stenomitos rutilans HA7619-LM2]